MSPQRISYIAAICLLLILVSQAFLVNDYFQMLNAQMDGFQVAEQIRSESNTPIIFTTARSGNEDFETAFSFVNTDYVRKPYRGWRKCKCGWKTY